MNDTFLALLILIIVLAVFLYSLKIFASKLNKQDLERNARYDAARKLYTVGQTITLSQDYYGQDLRLRKGRVGTIVDLPPDFYDAIVAFGDLEVCMNLVALEKFV